MKQILVARMNAEQAFQDDFNAWYDNAHMKQAGGVPGFAGDHRRYRAVALANVGPGKPGQEFTAIYEVESGANLKAAIDSDEFGSWSGDYLENWAPHTSDLSAVMCDQIHGDEGALRYERLLLEQISAAPDDLAAFEDWYAHQHLRGAAAIPGFGVDHRCYRSFEVEGKNWHYLTEPTHTTMYELVADTDPSAVWQSGQCREWLMAMQGMPGLQPSGTTWTICERIY